MLPPHPQLRPVRQRYPRRQRRPGASLARCAGGTARGREYQLRRGQRAQPALAAVSVLRRPHDHHRDIPARLLAALPSRGIHRRDQDRHIMISAGSRRHSSAALLLRRLSTSNDHARRHAALDSRLVVRSPMRGAGSTYCDRPTAFVTLDRFPTSLQCTSANRPPAPKSP